MRSSSLCAALLALPAAFLVSLATAFPSPATHVDLQQRADQHPFAAAPSHERPRWRKLSDHLIDAIWGPREDERSTIVAGDANAEKQAPPHTQARYGGDVVLRFNISTAEEARGLAETADTLLLDVWEFAQDWVDVRLSTDLVGPLLGLLPASLQHAHTPLLQERALAQAIYDTYPRPRGESRTPRHISERLFGPSLQQSPGEGNIFFSDYQPLSVIAPWLRLMASLFATHVRTLSVGVSYEGRDIPGLRVGVHPTNDDEPDPPKRQTILVFGGLHAREWISTSTVNYLAYNLITGYGKSPGITRMLEAFDFVFVPTVNPDGYVYTWETDRLWRKNRQLTDFRFCQGIDLDRSFGFEWDGAATTAGNPCSESFAGESPFEAVEARRLADWAKNETQNNNVEFVGLLDLHSYSQEILYPYGYSCDAKPPGLENLEELAFGLEKAIRLRHGHTYQTMSACEGNVAISSKGEEQRLWPRIEAAGGSALDWFYHELHVRYAYQIKLRDRGTYGFLLPKENIVPTGEELLESLLYFAGFLGEAFNGDNFDLMKTSTDEETAPDPPPQSQSREDDASDASDDEDDWVWVEDTLDPHDVSWELKRRRRR